MNTVEPIRDMDLIFDMADFLKARNYRDYVLFEFGIYTGLRICDILKFRVRDVKGKEAVYIRENKTGKEKRFPINDELKPILTDFLRDRKDWEYIFKSPRFPNQPITRQQAYNILSDAGKSIGVESVGTHTLRKTFGYHMYRQGVKLSVLKEIFNHSSEAVTARYIGINQDEKDKSMKGLTFKDKGKR